MEKLCYPTCACKENICAQLFVARARVFYYVNLTHILNQWFIRSHGQSWRRAHFAGGCVEFANPAQKETILRQHFTHYMSGLFDDMCAHLLVSHSSDMLSRAFSDVFDLLRYVADANFQLNNIIGCELSTLIILGRLSQHSMLNPTKKSTTNHSIQPTDSGVTDGSAQPFAVECPDITVQSICERNTFGTHVLALEVRR